MSTESPREQAAGNAAGQQAANSAQLAQAALPSIQDILSNISAETRGGFGSFLPGINSAFDTAKTGLDADYARAGQVSGASIRQRALQSGGVFAPDQINDATAQAGFQLEQDHQQALRNLNFNKSAANMQQFNALMGLLGAGSGAALNIGSGASGNQMQAIGGMSGSSPFGSALGGAASGASLGGSVGGGYGALIGAVAGGAAGYFGSGG